VQEEKVILLDHKSLFTPAARWAVHPGPREDKIGRMRRIAESEKPRNPPNPIGELSSDQNSTLHFS
jgi:hypothetical protein